MYFPRNPTTGIVAHLRNRAEKKRSSASGLKQGEKQMKKTIAAVLFILLLAPPVHSQTFSGNPKITQVDDAHWQLLEDLTYTAKDGEIWFAPKGYKTDGASIPPIFWPIIGSPFTGYYVSAAIIHDVYCDLKSRDWKKVHRTFYDAMIAGGTSPVKAKIMYFAVYRFGPKWVVDKTVPCPVGFRCDAQNSSSLQVTLQARPVANTGEMQDAAKKIELEDPSVSDIEEMADKQLFSHASRLDVVGKEIDHDGKQKTINQSFTGSQMYPVLSSK
jgi:hypothetical protein